MDEKELIKAVKTNRSGSARQSLFFPNVYFHQWDIESDLLEISRSNYLTEYEVKISKADLFKEYDKGRWNISDYDKHWKYGGAGRYKEPKIKSYYFVIPKKLYDKCGEEILDYIRPEHGLIYVRKVKTGWAGTPLANPYHRLEYVKNAKQDRTVKKLDDSELCWLLKKIYFRYWYGKDNGA